MSQTFNKLNNFILNQMRMSHIYQPAMLIELLQNAGSASTTQIASSLLARDLSQIEYYEQVTKNMVGDVLTRRRNITEKNGDNYNLKGFAELTETEIEKLKNLCEQKIKEYILKRGETIWAHRKKSGGNIPGSLRYNILKEAGFRCSLCGISADEKALEIDHIVPRNKGGKDDLSNLQALCYSCNSTKRDTDDTDFRDVAKQYTNRDSSCIFCTVPAERIITENELAFAFYDMFPVTKSHTLFVPKRHVADYFDLYQPERNAIQSLLETQRKEILDSDNTVSGFNVGINCGKDAGQTIFHAHLHLIPRRTGDTSNARGGVRGVIKDKQQY